MKKCLTFLMAGGKGERLFPLTKDRAKPAVPFGGIYRIVDFTLSNCINSGIRRIYILVQYKSMSLARHIRMGWNILIAEVDEFIDVLPAQQRIDEHWYQGTVTLASILFLDDTSTRPLEIRAHLWLCGR